MSTAGYSVVTVLHDSAEDLALLLASLERAVPAPEHVIAVDAGSSDAGPAYARSAGCTVLDAGDVGFGAANNAGLAAVTSPVTVLLNPDIVAEDPASLGALAALAAGRDALHVPRLLYPDGSVQDSAHPLPGSAAALLAALAPSRVLPAAAAPWRSGSERPVGWAIAAAVAARTGTLRRLGPFDPGQFLFFEDLDLCLRARAAGVRTVLHTGIALTHRGGHATGPAYGGEPLDLLAERRRAVVGERLGGRALARDDAALTVTLLRSLALRTLARQDPGRPRAQLRALRAARRGR